MSLRATMVGRRFDGPSSEIDPCIDAGRRFGGGRTVIFCAAKSSTTSLGLLATPAISILVALFLLGEQPTLILMLALTLILIGMAVGMSGPAAGTPRRR